MAHPAPYQGENPYVFISYSHRDSALVWPIVERMQADGYRVWYDEGIDPGTEWDENIAAHVKCCGYFVAFLSGNYLTSENCKDELNFARDLDKPRLLVYLEEVSLPDGMAMRLNRNQAVYWTRYTDPERFYQKLYASSGLDLMREGAGHGAASAEPADAGAGSVPTASGGNRRLLPVIAVAAAAVVLILAAVLIWKTVSGDQPGGEAPDAPVSSSEGEETPPEPEETELTMSDSLYDYTFTLDGVVYQLPFAYSQLTENGWAISDTRVSEETLVAGYDYENFSMVKNGSQIRVGAINMSGNVRAVKDCKIGIISVERDELADSGLFFIAGGIDTTFTYEEIIALLGTGNNTSSGESYIFLFYTQDDDNGVRFYCYTDMPEYNGIELRNFVADETDVTETSDQVPDYLAQYTAPEALGDDPLTGLIEIGGDVYAFPAPVSAFLENGWTISRKPNGVGAGNEESISLARDGGEVYVGIKNFADYQTTPENCAVFLIYAYENDGVEVTLPGGISFSSDQDAVERAITEEFNLYEGIYSLSYSYDDYDREFYLTVDLDRETGQVDGIDFQYEQWHYD